MTLTLYGNTGNLSYGRKRGKYYMLRKTDGSQTKTIEDRRKRGIERIKRTRPNKTWKWKTRNSGNIRENAEQATSSAESNLGANQHSQPTAGHMACAKCDTHAITTLQNNKGTGQVAYPATYKIIYKHLDLIALRLTDNILGGNKMPGQWANVELYASVKKTEIEIAQTTDLYSSLK